LVQVVVVQVDIQEMVETVVMHSTTGVPQQLDLLDLAVAAVAAVLATPQVLEQVEEV
jgi:hypothetical protein